MFPVNIAHWQVDIKKRNIRYLLQRMFQKIGTTLQYLSKASITGVIT